MCNNLLDNYYILSPLEQFTGKSEDFYLDTFLNNVLYDIFHNTYLLNFVEYFFFEDLFDVDEYLTIIISNINIFLLDDEDSDSSE